MDTGAITQLVWGEGAALFAQSDRLFRCGRRDAPQPTTLHPRAVTCLTYEQDRKMLYAADGKILLIWNTRLGKKVAAIPKSGTIRAIAFSKDNQWMATLMGRHRALLMIRNNYFQKNSGRRHTQRLAVLRLTLHPTRRAALHFAPKKEEVLICGLTSGSAMIWNYRDRRIHHVLSGRYRGEKPPINTAFFSPNGRRVTGLSFDRGLLFRYTPDTSTKPAVYRLRPRIRAAASAAGYLYLLYRRHLDVIANDGRRQPTAGPPVLLARVDLPQTGRSIAIHRDKIAVGYQNGTVSRYRRQETSKK